MTSLETKKAHRNIEIYVNYNNDTSKNTRQTFTNLLNMKNDLYKKNDISFASRNYILF